MITFVYFASHHSVEVYYMDYRTKTEINHEKYYKDYIVGPGAAYTEDCITIEDYNYVCYKVNGGEEIKSPSVPGNANGDVKIEFFYKKKPKITGDLPNIPEDKIQIPSTAKNKYGKIIVLDELFNVNLTVENASSMEEGLTVDLVFPFDVYNKDGDRYSFVSKGTLISKAYNSLPEINGSDEMNISMEFRLPSWILEKRYEGDNSIVGKIIDTNNGNSVISETTISVDVLGKVYDFTVTNLEGDSNWTGSLFAGGNQGMEYKADLLPIGQYSAKPNVSVDINKPGSKIVKTDNNSVQMQTTTYPYGIKLGSVFLFSINTKGNKSESISIEPKLLYLNSDGNPVDDVSYSYLKEAKQVDIGNSHELDRFFTTINKNTRLIGETIQEVTKAVEYSKGQEYLSDRSKDGYASIKNFYFNSNFNPVAEVEFGSYTEIKIPRSLRLPYVNYAKDIIKGEVTRIGKDVNKYMYGNQYLTNARKCRNE